MRIKKGLLPIGVLLLLLPVSVVRADSINYDVTNEETDQEIISTLKYSETTEGRAEMPEEGSILVYDGKDYELITAEVEYKTERTVSEIKSTMVTETIRLPSNDIAEIPKCKETDEITYYLDENSISIKEAELRTEEGSKVVTIQQMYSDLPDNDLARIPMTIDQDQITYELLYADYTVTAYDDLGTPIQYDAICEYGALETYTVSHPISWDATVTYDGYPKIDQVISSTIHYVYQYTEPLPAEIKPEEVKEEIVVSEEPTKTNTAVIAATAAGGIFFAVIVGGYFLTVPVFATFGSGKYGIEGYKYIGRMRLKRKKNVYEGKLSKSLAEKAEIDNYMIKIPKRIQKHATCGMINIICPGGRSVQKRMQDEVLFRLV